MLLFQRYKIKQNQTRGEWEINVKREYDVMCTFRSESYLFKKKKKKKSVAWTVRLSGLNSFTLSFMWHAVSTCTSLWQFSIQFFISWPLKGLSISSKNTLKNYSRFPFCSASISSFLPSYCFCVINLLHSIDQISTLCYLVIVNPSVTSL